MLVSFIIPIYNAENYICKCLDSVLAIARNDYEILIINDGSIDHTEEILSSYIKISDKIRVINQKNSGVSAARNNGVKHALGTYIFFIDADDVIEPSNVSYIMGTFDDKNPYDLILGNYCDIRKDDAVIKEYNLYNKIHNKRVLLDKVYLGDFLLNICWGKFLNKKIIIENQILFDSTMKYGEDTVFMGSFLAKTVSFKCFEKQIYYYRQFLDNTVNTLRSKLTKRYLDETEKIIAAKREYLRIRGEDENLKKEFIIYYSRHLSATVNLVLKENNPIKEDIKDINSYLTRAQMKYLLEDYKMSYGVRRYFVCIIYKLKLTRMLYIMIKRSKIK